MTRIGFGSLQCEGCGKWIQGDTQVVKVFLYTKQPHSRDRRTKTLYSLCVDCAKKNGVIKEVK